MTTARIVPKPVGRRWLDPMTRDYVVENGRPRGDTSKMQKVLLAIFTELGSCPLDKDLGSRIHELKKATTSAARVARGYIFDCLDTMVRGEEITQLEVDVTVALVDGVNALVYAVSFHDRSSADPRQLGWSRTFGSRTGAGA